MQTQVKVTLLELVSTLNSFLGSDREVVAMVTYLVNSGRVQLCGNFAGAKIEISPPVRTFSRYYPLLS